MSDAGSLGIEGYTAPVEIGRGGFGIVYRARDDRHDRDVAIKVISGPLGDTESRRFDRERRTMGALGSHPNIVTVYASGYTDAGDPYLAMELATGGSLADVLERRGPLAWPDAAAITARLADAVDVAHDAGVLHRDIKPANILISRYGEPKLGDFGVASVMGGSDGVGDLSGSLVHAAPELIEGQGPSPASDVYALGSTLFALLTGVAPFAGPASDGPAEVAGRILTEPVPDLRPLGVPEELCLEVERAMAKSPVQRHPSASALAAALRSLPAAREPVSPPARRLVGTRQAGPGADTVSAGTPRAAGVGGADAPTAVDRLEVAPHAAPAAPVPTAPVAAGAALVDRDVLAGRRHAREAPPAAPAAAAPATARRAGGGGAPVPEPSSERRRRRRRRLVPTVVVAVAAIVALVVASDRVMRRDGLPSPANATEREAADVAEPRSPTVSTDCPTEVVLEIVVECSIVLDGTVGGSWLLPGFRSEAAELVDGENLITIQATAPESIGRSYVLSAAVTVEGGDDVSLEHRFTVVAPPGWTSPTTSVAPADPPDAAESAAGAASRSSSTAGPAPSPRPTTRPAATASPTAPTTTATTAATATAPEVAVECPVEVPLGAAARCTVVASGATSGQWSADGLAPAAGTVDVVGGTADFVVAPIDSLLVGRPVTVLVTAAGDGGSAAATAVFTVVESAPPTVTFAGCPTEIAVGTRVECDVVAEHAATGSWTLPGFFEDTMPLDISGGRAGIFVLPEAVEAVGNGFVITATVANALGEQATAEHLFTVVAAEP